MTSPQLFHVAKLSQNAVIPSKATSESSAYDIFAPEPYLIPANGRVLINTGLQILLPKGTVGRILSRSGLALKHNITVFHGCIDEDYRKDLGVIVINNGSKDYKVNRHDRIAQFLIQPIAKITGPIECKPIDQESGHSGWGSTGK